METKKTAAVVTNILRLLNELDADECRRALQTAAIFFDVPLAPPNGAKSLPNLETLELRQQASIPFADREDISAKEFMLQKMPRTDTQRVACLAFYLSQYRKTPHFKTSDLSALNMEAAQQRIANMADAASNAVKAGYLVAAAKEQRQLSAYGEQFVLALPDQAAANSVMAQRKGLSRGRPQKTSLSRLRLRVDELQGQSSK